MYPSPTPPNNVYSPPKTPRPLIHTPHFPPAAYTFHVYGRSEGIAGVIISDHEYPKLVAHKLLSQVIDEFLTAHTRAKWAEGTPILALPQLDEYIVKYQDPKQADSIMKIQQELDETKIVLHKTIESVLERGEKIDNLVARSEGLSTASKMFYTQVRAGDLRRICAGTNNSVGRPRSRTHAA